MIVSLQSNMKMLILHILHTQLLHAELLKNKSKGGKLFVLFSYKHQHFCSKQWHSRKIDLLDGFIDLYSVLSYVQEHLQILIFKQECEWCNKDFCKLLRFFCFSFPFYLYIAFLKNIYCVELRNLGGGWFSEKKESTDWQIFQFQLGGMLTKQHTSHSSM